MDLGVIFTIAFAPFIAFLVISSLPKRLKALGSTVAIVGVFLSFLGTLFIFLKHPEIKEQPLEIQWTWLTSSQSLTLNVGFLLDRLNVLMLFIVTIVSFFVQVFSVSYMAEEGRGKARYFAFLSFFSFSMIGLVISNNLLQTFIFWELVGLASYLLIGFWYQKPSAALASRKAFVVTRLGDLGFYLAVALLILWVGNLNFSHLNTQAAQNLSAGMLPPPAVGHSGLSGGAGSAFGGTAGGGMLTLLAILIFTGVMGKSAQFPLHVWLPDAMEGPTPVSALIHSATMVAAGVFLTARTYAFFSASETAMLVILIFGTLTALTGATLAVIQNDIKKILAYSTISQLGLMMMALGARSYEGGMFHLTTHAFFKSLLFLAAGSLIHHFHTNDIWEMAKKGARSQRIALLVLWVGGLSLAGIPPFAGFWSKDLILEALHHQPIFYAAGLLVSIFTSYYVFRLLFILQFRSEKAHDHAHESGLLTFCMNFPLLSLAAGSIIAGLMGTHFTHAPLLKFISPPVTSLQAMLGHWPSVLLRSTVTGGGIILPQAHGPASLSLGEAGELSLPMAMTGIAVAAAGLILAYWNYLAKKAGPVANAQGMRKVLENKYYMDHLFENVLGRAILTVSAFFNWFDKQMINGKMVNGSARSTFRLGGLLAKMQTGELQDYLMILFFMGAAIIFFLVKF